MVFLSSLSLRNSIPDTTLISEQVPITLENRVHY